MITVQKSYFHGPGLKWKDKKCHTRYTQRIWFKKVIFTAPDLFGKIKDNKHLRLKCHTICFRGRDFKLVIKTYITPVLSILFGRCACQMYRTYWYSKKSKTAFPFPSSIRKNIMENKAAASRIMENKASALYRPTIKPVNRVNPVTHLS